MFRYQRKAGFTIIELLIVIVVIGILAGLVLVGYNGLQTRAVAAVLQSDLKNASTTLEDYRISNNDQYAATLEIADVEASGGTTYQYTYSADDNSYCLTATSSHANVMAYHISNTSGGVSEEGACEGHDDGTEVEPVFGTITWEQVATPPSFTGDSMELAMSEDGNKLFVCTNSGLSLSEDRGQTWSAVGVSGWYLSCDMSPDGQTLIAGHYNGYVRLSTDGGATWSSHSSIGVSVWQDVTTSNDGQTLAAVAANYIYKSIDGGANWVSHSSEVSVSGDRSWDFVDVSADGSRMILGGDSDSGVWLSSDYGATWTESTLSASQVWGDADMSNDGSTIYAVYRSGSSGAVYKSSDAGATWTSIYSGHAFFRVATSDDGTKVGALRYNAGTRGAHTSSDGGATWTVYTDDFDATVNTTLSIALNGNGAVLGVLIQGDGLYIGEYGP